MSQPNALDPVANAPDAIEQAFDSMDFHYLRVALEAGADEGWNFELSDIRRVEALWRLLDGDATSYGFVLELIDGRRVCVDYDDYAEDEVVEHVTMQEMGDERHPKLDGAIPGWEPAPFQLNRHFAN